MIASGFLPPHVSGLMIGGSAIAKAIKALYQTAQSVDSFLDEQIEAMKASANDTVRATGTVLEGAKYGFGIGYITPLIVIAVGQIILGNPLAAASTVATGVTLTNPVAMTCAAVGAIFYGWKALSVTEQDAILSRMMSAFEVGAELVRAILGYIVSTIGSVLSAENLEEVRRMVKERASAFGKSLSEITHLTMDQISDAATSVSSSVGKVTGMAIGTVRSGADDVRHGVASAVAFARDGVDAASQKIQKSAEQVRRIRSPAVDPSHVGNDDSKPT